MFVSIEKFLANRIVFISFITTINDNQKSIFDHDGNFSLTSSSSEALAAIISFNQRR